MRIDTLKRHHTSIKDIGSFMKNGYSMRSATIHNVDFTKFDISWTSFDLAGSVFLGCKFSTGDHEKVLKRGAIVFPDVKGLPYKKYRSSLYDWKELYELSPNGTTVDLNIYNHFSASKYDPSLIESLCQRLHDHAIDDALRDYLQAESDGSYKKKSIGVMGGHSTLRTDAYYVKTALICQKLAQLGYLICSGGGPGMMEATNLGAYFADYSRKDLLVAIEILKEAPSYKDEGFHEQAVKVIELFPNGKENLAIPTWFYGHEPSNLFASHIAKYFSNSIREDTLLAISIHGILYTPGSAGTTQEIFMDAAQNHYATFGYYSPMIFLGKQRYQVDTKIYDTLKSLSAGTGYDDLVHISDDEVEIVQLFQELDPIKV